MVPYKRYQPQTSTKVSTYELFSQKILSGGFVHSVLRIANSSSFVTRSYTALELYVGTCQDKKVAVLVFQL